jgi:hypothetical protein
MPEIEDQVRARYQMVKSHLSEHGRRLMLAAEARALGRGGVAIVSRATGASRPMIARGLRELAGHDVPSNGKGRRGGGGRKRLEEGAPGLAEALDCLIEPTTRGDPESPLRWTCKSTRVLASELRKQGYSVSHVKVATMLHARHYSLQSNRKIEEGGDHTDREAQFHHIQSKALDFQEANQPVISVDAKKKELIGNYKNAGREWYPEGDAPNVKVYDFIGKLGKVTPYGVYDIVRNEAWVNVGTDHDTAEFAVQSIRGWWKTMGHPSYPTAKRLMITADGGGSNGSRNRLWKIELQKLADETGLEIHVCHLPPGTSKWNKIEHRLFSRISQNWRGRPLIDHEVVVSLIGATTTTTGLTVRAELDAASYPIGRQITEKEMEALRIARDTFHGEWNYKLTPITRA